MKVESIYHRSVTCVAATDSLRRCAELMTARQVSALPVFEGDRLAGIITERDLVGAMSSGLDPSAATAGACMTEDAVTASPADETSETATRMLELGVRHLPVVEGGRLVGMVSARDLLQMEAWPPARH